MELKYGVYIDNEAIKTNLRRLTNQIYKLLPTWEEGADWRKPLTTIIEEIAGMSGLFLDHHAIFFPLLCKLEGLFTFSKDSEFMLFRKTIFEILGLVDDLGEKCV